jgi:hypothetical protein
MNWNEFEKKYDFENVVFELTKKSLIILGQSKEFDKTEFGAFAFTCKYGGSISLSFDADTKVNVRKEGYYPPDWTNEGMEYDLPEIGLIWKERYKPIEDSLSEIIEETDDYDFIDLFVEEFLNSLRRVIIKLENQKEFKNIKTTNNFWTLVTQVDADTDSEEELLENLRNKRD